VAPVWKRCQGGFFGPIPSLPISARDRRPGWLPDAPLQLFAALNLPILAVKDRLGCSPIQVTMDRYGHLLPAVTDAVVTGLDSLMREPSAALGS
jgi:hypothetical protein